MSARRLLVCDDEADFRVLVREVAETLGYEVGEVADSRECVTRTGDQAPDVIVLDIVMPHVDGIEIVQQLAARRFPGRVILVSGYNPHYARAAEVLARGRGIVDIRVFAKPIPLAELRAALSP